MKKLFTILALAFTISASAQIEQITLQASGLTCSMCSKAIYVALQRLPYTQNIISSIKESTYTISFDKNAKPDFDAIRKAVEDAGFSVVNMEVKANFNNIQISNDAHVTVGGETLHFLGVKDQTLSGQKTFRIIDEKFVAKKTYRKYAATSKMPCVKTGVMQSCCTKGITGHRIYHVTV